MHPPLAVGIPGLTELLVMLTLALSYLGVPALIAIAVYHFYDGKYGYDERIDDLEARIERLEDQGGRPHYDRFCPSGRTGRCVSPRHHHCRNARWRGPGTDRARRRCAP